MPLTGAYCKRLDTAGNIHQTQRPGTTKSISCSNWGIFSVSKPPKLFPANPSPTCIETESAFVLGDLARARNLTHYAQGEHSKPGKNVQGLISSLCHALDQVLHLVLHNWLEPGDESGTETGENALLHKSIFVAIYGRECAHKSKGLVNGRLGELGIGAVDLLQCLRGCEADLVRCYSHHMTVSLVQLMEVGSSIARQIQQNNPGSSKFRQEGPRDGTQRIPYPFVLLNTVVNPDSRWRLCREGLTRSTALRSTAKAAVAMVRVSLMSPNIFESSTVNAMVVAL